MAEASRSDVPRDVQPFATVSEVIPELELPERASPANNPALNRSAEAVGRGVGNAVANARRLPRQLDKLRSKIHVVKTNASNSAANARQTARDTAAAWRETAAHQMAELKDQAEHYTYAAGERANERLEQLMRHLSSRVDVLRRGARRRLADARRWETEQPLRVIGACAAVAFVLGVGLRIRRSYRD